ncbi:MAG TPA: hypothetical protein VFI25_00085 [Planctomycetota bacterium]|nr:hypothetical protein [Planctomycetota bacterium]
MKVSAIEFFRDGGTIQFTIEEDASFSGRYRLQTPFRGEPRPLFRGERKLPGGGREEKALLAALRGWFAEAVSAELAEALGRLDALHLWQDLSEDLHAAVPFHRMKTVIECIEARAS